MPKVKTAELEGIALDWAVAKALDIQNKPLDWSPLSYSTDWAQGGPIIERESIDLVKMGNKQWRADCGPAKTGSTPLIAAMRCYVANKLGDEVEIPERL